MAEPPNGVIGNLRMVTFVAPHPGEVQAPPGYQVFHGVLPPAVVEQRRRSREQQSAEEVSKEELEREQERKRAEQEPAVVQTRLVTVATSVCLVIALLLGWLVYRSVQTRNDVLAAVEEADMARKVAEKRLDKFKGSVEIIKALLWRDYPSLKELEQKMESLRRSNPELFDNTVRFRVTYRDLQFQAPEGEVYLFKISPDFNSIPGGKSAVASVSYRMPHPSFRKNMVETDRDNNFTASYEGYGVIDMIAIIEYADPQQAPSIAVIDMYRQQKPE